MPDAVGSVIRRSDVWYDITHDTASVESSVDVFVVWMALKFRCESIVISDPSDETQSLLITEVLGHHFTPDSGVALLFFVFDAHDAASDFITLEGLVWKRRAKCW